MNDKNLDYKIMKPGMALLRLIALFVCALILLSIIAPLLTKVIHRPEAALRILAVLQDVFIFLIPAFAMALLSTRLPARLLAVDKVPAPLTLLVAVATLLASVPAMNMVISFNENLHLPAAMASIETTLRQMEDAAASQTALLLSGDSIGALIISILIVGVIAGFSEELFFRGALQRLIMDTRMPAWCVIWLVAFIFSAFHFQFFGFIPRMLLGAYFGYLLYWTRSLWIPVVVHALNNSIYVITQWRSTATTDETTLVNFNSFGTDLSQPMEIAGVCLSALLTIGGIWWLKTLSRKDQHLAAIGK